MIRTFGMLVFMVMLFLPSITAAKNFEILTGEWAPYVSQKMKDGGPTAVIVNEAIKAAGHSVTFKYVPWKRTEVLTQSGKALATFPWTSTPGFEQTSFLAGPLASQRQVFFYLKSNLAGWDYTGLNDLKKLRVGGSPGYSYVDLFKDAGIEADYAADIEKSIAKLIHGRIDVVPESQLVGWQMIKDKYANDADKIASSKTPLFVKPLYLMVSKKHPDGNAFYDAFEKGFKIIKENGRYKQILDEYGLSE